MTPWLTSALHKGEALVGLEMNDVRSTSRKEVVDTKNVHTALEKSLTDMGPRGSQRRP